MRQFSEDSKIIKWMVTAGDLGVMFVAVIFSLILSYNNFPTRIPSISINQLMILLVLCFFPSILLFGTMVHKRIIKAEEMVLRVFACVLVHAALFFSLLSLLGLPSESQVFYIIFYALYGGLLLIWRLFSRSVIISYRRLGGNRRVIVIVGYSESAEDLCERLNENSSLGYHVAGFFDDVKSERKIGTYLGAVEQVIPWLQEHKINDLFCCLPSSRGREIAAIISYCENNLIRFYNVLDIRSYLKREMVLEMVGDLPVLSMREEPLTRVGNIILKRCFDIIFSIFVLVGIFSWLFIFIGIIIRMTSPGPIFFKQKRTGMNGRIFTCLKFRSMQINTDSDKLQATKDDPRKTKFGNFLRKSNLDEIPQFWNVLVGDMSIVGPRPHMLKHTDEYAHQVNKYMVRHFAKPGITGLAQVTGFRGEISNIRSLEGRVRQDIYYIEHWSIFLDLWIIIETILRVFRGDNQAY